jgi:MscS family membrane protein
MVNFRRQTASLSLWFKISFTLLIVLGYAFSANAQIDPTKVNQSVYGVVYNHLYYLQLDSYKPKRAAKSLPVRASDSKENAVKLKKIIDGKGFYIDLNRLPTSPTYIDSTTNENIYFLHKSEPRIYVELKNGRWQYSETTLQSIPEMYKEVFPFGGAVISLFSNPFWEVKVLNVKLLSWTGGLILLLIAVLIFYLTSKLSDSIVSRFVRTKMAIGEDMEKRLTRLARLVGLIVGLRFFLYFIPMFQFPVLINAGILKIGSILNIFFIILLVIQISKIVSRYMAFLAQKTQNTLDDQLVPVLSKLANIVIWAVGSVFILDKLEVNVTALLAGISIGGLALALAAQDTVKNFFGSLMIFLDRPFQIGDWINFGDVDGVVEEVGVRSTRIRSFANSVIYVPNSKLADGVINNMGLRKYRRFTTTIGVTYNTPPERIDLFVEGIKEIIKVHPTTRKDYFEVHLNGLGSSSINILLYTFFEADNWTAELAGKHEVIYAIICLAHDLNVSFAFPSQSLYIETMPGVASDKKQINSKEAEQALKDSVQKINTYFKREILQSPDKFRPLGGE